MADQGFDGGGEGHRILSLHNMPDIRGLLEDFPLPCGVGGDDG
jgi:hypothetical protein